MTVDGRKYLVRVFHVGRRTIWGLTAAILHNLLARLGLPTDLTDPTEA